MNFTTLRFLGAVAVLALVYRAVPSRFRGGLLLLASYAYCCFDGRIAVAILASVTAISFAAAIGIERLAEESASRRVLFTGSVLLLLSPLLFFKLRPTHLRHIALPLGLSYYTFKLISYVTDVHWGKLKAEKSVSSLGVYAAFFPQILAGPVHRAKTFLPQLAHPKAPAAPIVLAAVQRILLGLFKKFVIADSLAPVVNGVWGHLPQAAGADVILAFYAFPVQLYADFSGLIDISIGVALLFGILSPENFNLPFFAATPSDFWRRWHITLANWLGDYVFAPMRTATRNLENLGLVISIVVTMLGIGLWHGFQWTYAVFGLYHAFLLCVDTLTQRMRKRYYAGHPWANRMSNGFGILYTFHAICVSLVLFRAPNLTSAGEFLVRLIGAPLRIGTFSPDLRSSGRSIIVAFAAYAVAEVADWARRRYPVAALLDSMPRWARWSLYSCTTVAAIDAIVTMFALNVVKNPFMYAVF